MNTDLFINKLRSEIQQLRSIQTILSAKNPSHGFLDPTINNAIASMVELRVYLEGKNPYYKRVSEEFFKYRQVAMHRSFFSDLHIGVEEGLKEIIETKKFKIVLNRRERILGIVNRITQKVPNVSVISKELKEIMELGGDYPTFNDFLNGVLNNIGALSESYKKECRIYFDGISIIRNKVSHSEFKLSEQEKVKLKRAKLGKVIASDGNLQMTFEGYKLLINDAVRFFDTIQTSD